MQELYLLKKDTKTYYLKSKCRNILNFLGVFLQTPSLWAIISFRVGGIMMHIRFVRGLYIFLIWNPIRIITGIEIYPGTKIGENFYIKHFGGIFIHPKAVIGKDCLIFNNVTIGTDFDEKEFPLIGDNVVIGVGAKIIGGLKIGDNVTVGANAVVTKDIPEAATVFGNPAVVKLK